MIPLSTVSCVSVSLGFIYLRCSSGLTGHSAGVVAGMKQILVMMMVVLVG